MKTYWIPWLVAILLLTITFGFLPNVAEAKCSCRSNKGTSNAEALGEEYPESVGPGASASEISEPVKME